MNQSRVVHALMENFDRLFDVTADELATRTRLAATISALPRTADALPAKKPATGMLLAIDVLEPDVNAFNIESRKTADEIVKFAIEHRRLPTNNGQRYALFETARDSQLRRLVAPHEAVHDIVLDRWMSWGCDESPRCSLIVLTDTWTPAIEKATPFPFVDKVYVSLVGKTKFTPYALQYSQGRVALHKDADKLKSPIKEWNVEDLLWYFGNEVERKCQTRYTLTMVDTAGATGGAVHKQRPMGVCMCFVEREHMLQWLTAVLPTRAHRPHASSTLST